MHADSASWQVARANAAPVDFALYVRDALALSVDVQPFVPGLAPPVEVIVPAGVDRAVVAREWPGWWRDVLEWCRADEDPDQPPYPATAPALRTALEALREPELRYRTANRRPVVPPTMVENEVVDELERELGRKAQPFRFRITEVSVGEPMWAQLTPTHVLSSKRFVDSEAGRPALRDALRPLA
jgi:hypothetical protein